MLSGFFLFLFIEKQIPTNLLHFCLNINAFLHPNYQGNRYDGRITIPAECIYWNFGIEIRYREYKHQMNNSSRLHRLHNPEPHYIYFKPDTNYLISTIHK